MVAYCCHSYPNDSRILLSLLTKSGFRYCCHIEKLQIELPNELFYHKYENCSKLLSFVAREWLPVIQLLLSVCMSFCSFVLFCLLACLSAVWLPIFLINYHFYTSSLPTFALQFFSVLNHCNLHLFNKKISHNMCSCNYIFDRFSIVPREKALKHSKRAFFCHQNITLMLADMTLCV